jgi:flagellar basal-body rod protein FlgB
MNLDDIPLFSMLRSRLGYLNQRQQVVAQNIANADTPSYVPRDLAGFSFKSHMANQTPPAGASSIGGSAPHMIKTTTSADGVVGAQGWKMQRQPDSETTLDGNQVVLEDQMMKMSEARMDYDAAIGFYQKSLSLIRMAVRAPGK